MQIKTHGPSKLKTQLKEVCGNHEFAIKAGDEIGWEDELNMSDLDSLSKIYRSVYIYIRETDEVREYVRVVIR